MTGQMEHRALPTPRTRPTPPPNTSATSAEAAPETMIVERYRLINRVGVDTAVDAEFWCARDTTLEREVGITLLRSRRDGGAAAARAADMIKRARRGGPFEHRGCARLLDVVHGSDAGLPPGVCAMAITEWVPGRSLAEMTANGLLRPLTVVQIVEPLAEAAEAAHRTGLVLGCNHPQRIRITPDGQARMAFALPRPETSAADDVRGLGAVLYALLTGRWPLSGTDAARAGLPGVRRAADGTVLAPGALRPGVPHELAAVTLGALGPTTAHGRVHTAAAVHQVLVELNTSEGDAALLPPVDDGVPASADDVWQDIRRDVPTDPSRRRKLRIGLAAMAGALLVVVVYVGLQVASLFTTSDAAPTIVVGGPSAAAAVHAPGAAPAAASGTVAVADIAVYDPTGDRDNAGRVARVIDGDPRSSWRTFVYRRPFPALKPGVGVMLSFASPVQLTNVTIVSPSPGTKIEIRSAPSVDAPLDATVQLATVTLQGNTTQASLANSQPVQHVLLWITTLSGGNESNVTEISEVTFQRALG